MCRYVLIPAAFLALLVAGKTQAEEGFRTFTSRAHTYTVSYPIEYKKIRNSEQEFEFTAQKGLDHALFIAASETAYSLDSVVNSLKEQITAGERGPIKDISMVATRVAGTRASLWTSELAENGRTYIRYITILVRQGVAYRIVGVTLKDTLDFTLDYTAFVKSFEFTGDRQEWLEKYVGKPVNITLLGGLGSLELNQPRWIEKTWTDKTEYGIIEHASFNLFGGGGWIQIDALASKMPATDELASVHRTLEQLMPDMTPAKTAPQQAVAFPIGLFKGSSGGLKRTFRTAALVEEGVAIRLYLECLDSQLEETEKDWQQLLRTLKLRKKSDPAAVQAYAIPEGNLAVAQEPSPVLKAIFGAARLVVKTSARKNVLSVSPDGKWALVSNGASRTLLDTNTHEEIKIKAAIPPLALVAFSPDSKRLAWPGENQIHLLTLPEQTEAVVKVSAREVAFAGSSNELLVSVPVTENALTQYIQHLRLDTSTLQRVSANDGHKTPLVAFPFSRCESAAISPDNKRIALMCNRDEARTKLAHVYMCGADGTNLKQLTHGSEELRHLAWSPDGTALFGYGGPREPESFDRSSRGDVYRIDTATGACRNLTKCNEIQDAWFVGNDIFLEIGDYTLSDEKHGLYRISSSELERALATIPLPEHVEMKDLLPRVAEKVKAAFAGKKIDDLVLDHETIKKAARAFADAAGSALNVRFDFSTSSLKHLRTLLIRGSGEKPPDRAYILGAGAYYGETLHQAEGAEWKIKPLPFGQWLPAAYPRGNSLVHVVLPFSAIHDGSIGHRGYMGIGDDARNREDPAKRILVYPPGAAAEMVAEASDPNYVEAFKRFDSGEIEKAGELMAKVMAAHPRNSQLARETIALCEAAGLPELSKRLVRAAVDNGSEVTELLVRCGDEAAEKDPAKAMQLYRRATQHAWDPGDAFTKLGKLYAAQNKSEIARSCWRRALLFARGKERNTAIKLLDPDAVLPPITDDVDLDE